MVRENEDELPAGRMVVRDPRIVHKFQHARTVGGDVEGEIGTTGLRQYGGYVLEEWLAGLQGKKAAWAYREMMDNDPVVGAILFAIEMLARGVAWRVEGGDAERAEFVESCMHDMTDTWLDFISEALSFLPYGWAYHELVYKKRMGKIDPLAASLAASGDELGISSGIPQTEEESNYVSASSEFKDGKIGWRKIPVRAQETLLRWRFRGYSSIAGMEQIDWHGGLHVIPIEKALLFRTKATRNNPEGRSILRNSWTSFYRMSNIQQIEAIGIERDLAGIPKVSPPPGTDLNQPQHKAVREAAEEMVQAVRRDEDEGILFPTAGWEFELVTTGGARQIDTDAIIRRYEQRIASSMLADFVLLGQDAIGSFAMVDIKSELFGVAIDTVLNIICETFNKYAIPRLLALNGMKLDDPPIIAHSSAGRIDLEKVGRFLQSVALAGGPIPWSRELIEELFKEAGLPARFDSPLETEAHPTGDVHRTGAGDPALERDGQRPQGPQNDARERDLPISKADTRSGAMVALYPSPTMAQELAQDGGEPVGELHLTLAFMGQADAIQEPERLRAIVAGFAASCAPFIGKISGVGHFAEPENVTYASADIPFLEARREKLRAGLRHGGYPVSDVHGFQPHITLAYDNITPKLPTSPITFESISLVLGGKREDFPLTGTVHNTLAKSDESPSPAEVMRQRYELLAAQLESELQGALSDLGEEAATAYLHEAQKARGGGGERRINAIVKRVMNRLDVKGWVDTRLLPVLRNAAGRTMLDAQRVLQRETNLELSLSEEAVREVTASAGSQLQTSDIEPQVRAAIVEAIHQGLQAGDNPITTAQRIRQAVPAGRFTGAGSGYRAQLIARNETANMQRGAQIGLYESNPRVPELRLRDGIYGPPRSDAACIERDGETVPIGEARKVLPYHPLCTLGFDPIVK